MFAVVPVAALVRVEHRIGLADELASPRDRRSTARLEGRRADAHRHPAAAARGRDCRAFLAVVAPGASPGGPLTVAGTVFLMKRSGRIVDVAGIAISPDAARCPTTRVCRRSRSYRLIYMIRQHAIQILGVIHGRRDR